MAELVSPLEAVALPGRYGRIDTKIDTVGVVISQRVCVSLVQLVAWPKTNTGIVRSLKKITGLTIKKGLASPANDSTTIMPIGPGRLLIESEDADFENALRQAIAPDDAAITGLGHARVVVRISGDKASWVLAKGITVDFSTKAFPVATCLVTSHHDTGLTIRRIDEQTFELYLFTSLARGFWQWLEKAAGEVGYDVV